MENRSGQSGWQEAEEASCCSRSSSRVQGDENFAGPSLTQSINNNVVCSGLKSVTFSLTILSSAFIREKYQPRTIQMQAKSCLWHSFCCCCLFFYFHLHSVSELLLNLCLCLKGKHTK